MEDSCPPTPLHVLSISSPESDRMKSPSDRLSPDSRCVICLGRLMNKSFTDSCLHQFCFQCLLQWSKVKPECPLCKQPFKSIIHNVRSNKEYDQYHIERGESAISFLHSFNIDLYQILSRHRYRTTITTMAPENYIREIFRDIVTPWLNREGNVLIDNCSSHVLYVIDRIVSTIPQQCQEFRAVVQPYFGAQTDHFIHELHKLLRSVLSGLSEFDEISSSNDEDSDIEVIETVQTGETRKPGPKEGFKKILLKRAGGSRNIDEPVPGPSGLNNQGIQEPIEVGESDSDEVEVLDYVKPEPEIVTLSSGEEEEETNEHIVHFSDLELSNGDFAEMPCNISDDEETIIAIQLCHHSSGNYYEPYKKTTKYKSPKGKQKKKYIKSRKARKDKSSSSSEEDRSRQKRRRISSSSSSSSRSSSTNSSDSDYRRRRRDTSSSDNEPTA